MADTTQSSAIPEFSAGMDICLKAFDKDEDNCLNQSEFSALCRALFRNECGKPYTVEPAMLSKIFQIFDVNKDDLIDKEEFKFCWQRWINQIVKPVTALVIVDVQNDFIDGDLDIRKCPAKQNGEEVIAPINKLIDEVKFDAVFYTLDWHPANHISFMDNVHLRPLHKDNKIDPKNVKPFDVVLFDIHGDGKPFEQPVYPRHCVQDSWGSELHKDLKRPEDHIIIHKATNPEIDSFSAFWDNSKANQTKLDEELKKRHVTDVFICGLAYDICVGATVNDAQEAGYRTLLVEDATRAIDSDNACTTRKRILDKHGMTVQCSQVKSLASGRDRPPVLGYSLALELSKELVLKQDAN